MDDEARIWNVSSSKKYRQSLLVTWKLYWPGRCNPHLNGHLAKSSCIFVKKNWHKNTDLDNDTYLSNYYCYKIIDHINIHIFVKEILLQNDWYHTSRQCRHWSKAFGHFWLLWRLQRWDLLEMKLYKKLYEMLGCEAWCIYHQNIARSFLTELNCRW